ncbi:MAG: UMP kinase [Candidatus Spyradocola sp.]|jgi:uridylate kinase
MKPIYKRVLIKLSGEALGENGKGFCAETLEKVAEEVVELAVSGLEVALVIGGGNIWRGREGAMVQMDRATADYMGMLATVLNALAVQDAIERLGVGRGPDGSDVQCRVQTAIEMRQIAEPYIRRRAVRHLEKGRIVIFACGTGSPFFTTDTTAALRAAEIGAEALLLAKNTDYIYTADPRKDPNAKPIEEISYLDVIDRGLTVMDNSALTLCMDNHIPILVFGLKGENNIMRVACGEKIGTIVR